MTGIVCSRLDRGGPQDTAPEEPPPTRVQLEYRAHAQDCTAAGVDGVDNDDGDVAVDIAALVNDGVADDDDGDNAHVDDNDYVGVALAYMAAAADIAVEHHPFDFG